MISWITSLNRSLYQNQIYNKCINSWSNLPGNKILFSEDNFTLNNFQTINLDTLVKDNNPTPVGSTRTFFRFYYKALSIYTALTTISDSKYIVWLDSDIEVLKSFDQKLIESNHPISSIFYNFPQNFVEENNISHTYGADTGIIIFNKEKLPANFAKDYIDYWHNGYIKNLYRQKDAWVFCDLIHQKYKNECFNLIENEITQQSLTNYFQYTKFKNHLYHYIGKGQKYD